MAERPVEQHSPGPPTSGLEPVVPKRDPPRRESARLETGVGPASRGDLCSYLMGLMFPENEDQPILSENRELFRLVMSTLHNYEMLKPEPGGLLKVLLKKIHENLVKVFHKDFPFYILLVHRIYPELGIKYNSVQGGTILKKCQNLMENEKPRTIAETLVKFMRNDFTVKFNRGKPEESVLMLLEQAFYSMSKIVTHGMLSNGKVNERFFYTKLLWVSLGFKVMYRYQHPPEKTEDLLKEYFPSRSHRVILNNGQIDNLVKAIDFCKTIQLPMEFNVGDICSIFVSYLEETCHFQVLRYFYEKLHTHLGDKHFLNTLISFSCVNMQALMSKQYQHRSQNETLPGTLDEGISFLQFTHEVWTSRNASSDTNIEVQEVFRKWVKLLLNLVDVTQTECLMKLSEAKLIKENFLGECMEYVTETNREKFLRLDIHKFVKMCTYFEMCPLHCVTAYLEQYEPPESVDFSEPPWTSLFDAVLERYPGAHQHSFLCDFLKKVGQRYVEDNKPHEFILRLLKLRRNKLLVNILPEERKSEAEKVHKSFIEFLRNFITHSLQGSLQNDLVTINECLATERDELQQLVLTVLKEKSILKFTILWDKNYQNSIVGLTMNYLCQTMTSSTKHSPKLYFCWEIVFRACEHVSLPDGLDWVSENSNLITLLCDIYWECKMTDLEEDILHFRHNDEISGYFEWAKKVVLFFQSWQKKIEESEFNYDEIIMCEKLRGRMKEICKKIHVPLDVNDILKQKDNFCQMFENLNILFLMYIPDRPESKWCSLSSILVKNGVSFPKQLEERLRKHIAIPGEHTNIQLVQNELPPNATGKFNPGHNISLKLSNELKLKELINLVKELRTYLQPIADHMGMLVFFELHKSVMFENYQELSLRGVLKPPKSAAAQSSSLEISLPGLMQLGELEVEHVSINDLALSLDVTKALLLKMNDGSATYREITCDGQCEILSMDLDREFKIVTEFIRSLEDDVGLASVKNILELFKYTSNYIVKIHSVCRQFQLEGCLNDPRLKELVEIADELASDESKQTLTVNDATIKLRQIQVTLFGEEGDKKHCLELFNVVAESAPFHLFIKKRKSLFIKQYELITAQLQHEEYNEHVLNNLRAAFSFISPFLDTNQDFKSLMDRVVKLETSKGLKHLQIVNSNMTLIQLWFTRAEGDTLHNVAECLKCIINSGYFNFVRSSGASGVHSKITLCYTPLSGNAVPHQRPVKDECNLQSSDDINGMAEAGIQMEMWNSEQISDFVLKLGFLDAKGENDTHIKKFLHINEVAHKIHSLHIQLKDLGHPKYLLPGESVSLSCKTDSDGADRELADMQDTLKRWTVTVSELRSKYPYLLFLTMPKLLQIYHILWQYKEAKGCRNVKGEREGKKEPLNEEETVIALMKELPFLFSNDPPSRATLEKKIQVCMPRWCESIASSNAMESIGRFLGVLFKEHGISHCAAKPLDVVSGTTPSLETFSAQQFLHHAPKYQQLNLMRLVVQICNGVPEYFEVFHCHSSSTKADLSLFLKRMERNPLRYIVIEVNKLPPTLQEYFMQWCLKIQQMSRKAHSDNKSVQRRENSRPYSTEDVETTQGSEPSTFPTIHFLQTAPSVLGELPWIILKEYKGDGPTLTFESAERKCKNAKKNWFSVKLVYGNAGDGKTHYIKEQMKESSHTVIIAVNEAFTSLGVIQKLRKLPLSHRDCSAFLNFTLLPPGRNVDESEERYYNDLVNMINCFFFDLVLLGYVEDPVTGLSVSIPARMGWKIYVEVPCQTGATSPNDSLVQFKNDFPALALVGDPVLIEHNAQYRIDEDVQLVCKYLKAYWQYMARKKEGIGINRLVRRDDKPVMFSNDPDIPQRECCALLERSWSVFSEGSKLTREFSQLPKVMQKLYIMYMKRRCSFLNKMPGFIYNSGKGEAHKGVFTDTSQLGSTLMGTMLREVKNFCNLHIKHDWTQKAHQQLIYDFKDGGGSFALLCPSPEKLEKEEKEQFEKIGVQMPSIMELHERKTLDEYLSRALGLQLKEGYLPLIDESEYVLTLDYTLKMLNMHERQQCGVPVIIEGETGVGKTALVEMLSKLWNQSQLLELRRRKDHLFGTIKERVKLLSKENPEDEDINSLKCLLESNMEVKVDDLLNICRLKNPSKYAGYLHTTIRLQLLNINDDPSLSLIRYDGETSLNELFTNCSKEDNAEATAELLHAIRASEVVSTFHKINVHAALTPCQVWHLLQPAIKQANSLQDAYKSSKAKVASLHVPLVTVFLDEVNTSSCLGLFKEIIIDHTFDGEPIPDNIFIVAACNPHRGNSLAIHAGSSSASSNSWTRSTYYVRQLHPTLEFLKWDYGALDKHQEADYISVKMKMLNKKEVDVMKVEILSEIVAECQKLMREYAGEELKSTIVEEGARIEAARSCVSQRDIQRVFRIFQWFQKLYQEFNQHGSNTDYLRRALFVSLGIVYYMRLNNKYRKMFVEHIDQKYQSALNPSFSEAYMEELKWFSSKMELPTGIAQTQALIENLFATVVCTGTRTPLIIVGAPGSSKTLSFNLAVANIKGQESKMEIFRRTTIFPSLDPHFYQCSRRTTSNEIETVFSRAVNRQRSHYRFSLPIHCVVFMDEAGLPEESHESLKVLHYHLDRREVSFVAITNHMLDAAKTNRAVCLFRPETMNDDLPILAKGCLTPQVLSPPPSLQRWLELVSNSCTAFSTLMNDRSFRHFFGLRDFIHFINYIRRHKHKMDNVKVVMEAIERNFSGSENFDEVANTFMREMKLDSSSASRRNILDVLSDSLHDQPHKRGNMTDSEVRYKLIIDTSEDGSVINLLFSLGVLDRQKTRMYVCSDLPGDSQTQKIDTIAAIRHSALEGHTVVMSETDSVHESFYDLFNQRFRCIEDPKTEPRYFTNIAIGAHSRPCRVNPNFQCVVIVKESEVKQTPAPFLNRFEKYRITHSTLLTTVLAPLPPLLKKLVMAAKEKVESFVKYIGPAGFYGLKKQDTVDSLIISILPPFKFQFKMDRVQVPSDPAEMFEVYVLRLLLEGLRQLLGFNIPHVLHGELQSDAEEIFSIACNIIEFRSIIKEMKKEWQVKDKVERDNTETSTIPDRTEEKTKFNAGNEEILTKVVVEGKDANGKANAEVVEAAGTNISKESENRKEEEKGGANRAEEKGNYTEELIHEAIGLLHSKQEQLVASPQVGLVVQMLLQWLVCHLVKRIMQLMTVEAFIEHSSEIPVSYVRNYLSHQAHFSLRKLINMYQKRRISQSEPTSKLLCLTRSSSLIHQIPTTYYKRPSENEKTVLQNLVHEDVEELIVCKLSSIPSQRLVLDLLRTFINSGTANVLIIVVNMQQIKQKEVVNHIRIMIEQEEAVSQKQGSKQKLFVLLLHFPPTEFRSRCCYPSLFLHGWDHYYLDTIAHSVATSLDIQMWLQTYCFPQETLPTPNQDPLIKTLEQIMKEAIPILASRVHFGAIEGACFNKKTNVSRRTILLQDLFYDKQLGSVLCNRFRSYWKPSVMSKYIEGAVTFTKTQDSSLSITDSIHSTFKKLFFDFLVYMITQINEDCNIDVLFLQNPLPAMQQLFLTIVEELSIPELSELSLRSVHCQLENKANCLPQFPFFKIVCVEIDRVIEECRESVNARVNLLGDFETATSTFHNQQSYFRQLTNAVVEKFQEMIETEKGCTTTLLKAIEDNPMLWDYYFKNFIAHTLHLDRAEGISLKIMQAYLLQLREEKYALKRVVQLHVYTKVSYLKLAKITTVLRSLDQTYDMTTLIPSHLIDLVTAATSKFIDTILKWKNPLGTPELFSTFVVDHFFGGLAGAANAQTRPSSKENAINLENMLKWYQCYRNVMSLSYFKQMVYSCLSASAMEAVEARFNVMQSVFIVMQSCTSPTQSEPSLDILTLSRNIFLTMYETYFNEKGELTTSCPRLCNVSQVLLLHFPPKKKQNCNQIRLIMEGLFFHFFCTYRPSYHEEDRKWFLELANCQQDWCVSESPPSQQEQNNDGQINIFQYVPKGAISLSVFKMYISRLLGNCDKNPSKDCVKLNPLTLYQHQQRLEIGKVVMDKPGLGDPAPYLPVFYQKHPTIKLRPDRRMQQPLAHLYFLTVYEHLMSEQQGQSLSIMVDHALYLSDCCSGDMELECKVPLQIELQAVLQVITKLIGEALESDDYVQINKTKISKVNELFSNPCTGGGEEGGHGIIVALHLFNKFKSSQKFLELLKTNFVYKCQEIRCLQPIHERLKQEEYRSIANRLPFILLIDEKEELKCLYRRVKKAMHELHKEGKDGDLKEIAAECSTNSNMSGGEESETSKTGHKYCNFKMVMWLIIFYDFFDKKEKSHNICEMIEKEEFSSLVQLTRQEVQLFQCFLDPTRMICKPEDTKEACVTDKDVPLQSEKGDFLHKLFFCKVDDSDEDMRYALANMVAVVLGCIPQSNHLWYHLFDQQSLHKKYLTGFMYNKKIGNRGYYYDCGIELTEDGQFGKSAYNKHANRGTYDLHSLYLLLWINIGAFCMALLTQPDALDKIKGPLISGWQPVRLYCISQLRMIWAHIRINLMLSEEEHSFLIMSCMKKFYMEFNTKDRNPEISGGIITSSTQLDSYEKLLHLKVFKPSRDELRTTFPQYLDLMKNTVLMEIRNLESQYPNYPNEQKLFNSIQSEEGSSGDLALLSQFSLQWKRLQTGEALLPHLVEFYTWLHTELAYIISEEEVYREQIRNIINRAVKKCSEDRRKHLQVLFDRVKGGYNKYVELIGGTIGVGACGAGNKIQGFKDHTKLVHFLSVGDEEEGNDWLFIVIADIIKVHNNMVELPRQLASKEFLGFLPKQQEMAYPGEITPANCIVPPFKLLHGVSDLLQLFRGRHRNLHPYPPPSNGQEANCSSAPLFYLQELQEDVLISFIVGKPIIHDMLRLPFRFKQKAVIHQACVVSSDELKVVERSLPKEFKQEMEREFFKGLEIEFHASGYEAVEVTTTCLRIAVGYLEKCTKDDVRSISPEQSLADFLLSLEDGKSSMKEVLKKINSRVELNTTQIECLSNLPLANLNHCLNTFFMWMENGMYDFSGLPLALKVHLEPNTVEALKAIPHKWKAAHEMADLKDEIDSLNKQLSHCESYIRADDQTPIIPYLTGLGLIDDDDDKLPPYIPETVLNQHYVHLRIILRVIMREVQQMLEKQTTECKTTEKKSRWSHVVEELWTSTFRKMEYSRDESHTVEIYLPSYERESEEENDIIQAKGEGELESASSVEGSVVEVCESKQKLGDEEIVGGSGDKTLPRNKDTGGGEEPGMSIGRGLVEKVGSIDHGGGESGKKQKEGGKDGGIGREKVAGGDTEGGKVAPPKHSSPIPTDEDEAYKEAMKAAQQATPEEVAEFISSIGLEQYSESFLEDEMDGNMMLIAKDCDLADIVESRLHQVKIIVLFKRRYFGKTPKSLSVDDVANFLKQNKLQNYVESFKENCIDGDILEAILSRSNAAEGTGDMSVADIILQDLGVKKGPHRLKIKSKFSAFSEFATSSSEN